jgi:hypothetical protein
MVGVGANHILCYRANEASVDPLSDDERYADGLLSDMPEMQQVIEMALSYMHTYAYPSLPF